MFANENSARALSLFCNTQSSASGSLTAASKSLSDREARGMPPRSALLRAIRKFLARQRKRRRRRDETSPRSRNSTESSPIQQTTLSSRPPPSPRSLPLRAAVSLARYLPRSIGRSVYCFKRKSAPERNVFPVVSRVVWPLKYKQPSESRGPKLGIRLARQEVIWRVAREHLGRTESFRPPRPARTRPSGNVAKLR